MPKMVRSQNAMYNHAILQDTASKLENDQLEKRLDTKCCVSE